jgi:type II secretory pathway pseudopilin PulG
MRSLRSSRGFTLVEAVVAAALMATAIVFLAQLASLGARQSDSNRRTWTATVAAQSKLEELRAVPWTNAIQGRGLQLSPAQSLVEDVAGYVEALADVGFTLRWAVSRFDGADPNTLILQVCVFRRAHRDQPPEACVMTVRTRRP